MAAKADAPEPVLVVEKPSAALLARGTLENIDRVSDLEGPRTMVECVNTDLTALCKPISAYNTLQSDLRDAHNASSWTKAQ